MQRKLTGFASVFAFGWVVACGHPPPVGSLGATATCVAGQQPISPEAIEQTLRPNILQIESESSLGSGFIIQSEDDDDVLVVTNYHVIAEGSGFSVTFVRQDGTRVDVSSVEVVKTSPDHDLALLKTPRMKVYGSGISMASSIRTGESVATLGYPVLSGAAKAEPSLSSGLVTSTKVTIGDRDFVQTNVPLVPGASGGPVVDSCGLLVGVAAARHAEVAHVGLLVPVEQVVEIYRQHVTPRQEPAREVNHRVTAFLRSLQHNEERRASAYFSRAFIASNVLPAFEHYVEEITTKRKLWAAALKYLTSEGIDVEQLTPEQIERLSLELGTNLTVEELHTFQSIQESSKNGSDAYAMLQAFYAPFVDGYFGAIDSFRIEEISSRGNEQVAYVSIDSGPAHRSYRIHLIREWGDWRIQDVFTRAGINQSREADTRQNLEEETKREMARGESADSQWRPVSSTRP